MESESEDYSESKGVFSGHGSKSEVSHSPDNGVDGASKSRQLNRQRAAWYTMALLVFAASGLWFCVLQPPASVVVGSYNVSGWKKWWRPIEYNAAKRLPTVPYSLLNAAFFTNGLGWVVGEGGVILHTEDGGKNWMVQTNINWGEAESPISSESTAGHQPFGVGDNSIGAGDSKVGMSSAYVPRPKPNVQQSAPQDLATVCFVNAQIGWAAGENGTILHTTDGGSKWALQPSQMTTRVGSMVFADEQNGWAVCDDGTILHTTDGGMHWGISYSAFTGLDSVTFVDSRTGWVAGEKGVILYTSDGGATWTPQTNTPDENLISIRFVDARNGWAVGVNGTILHTVDAGQNWKLQPIENKTQTVFSHIRFVDTRQGWAIGAGGVFLHTVNGGTNWDDWSSSQLRLAQSMFFEDAWRGWAFGQGGIILSTQDGGRTWGLQTANGGMRLQAVAFANDRQGWAVGLSGTILYTDDGGKSWEPQTVKTDADLYSITIAGKNVWIAGDDGTILHTEDAGLTWAGQSAGIKADWKAVSFIDPQTGWAVGNYYNGGIEDKAVTESFVIHTKDGGKTWMPQLTNNTLEKFAAVSFLNSQSGWVLGESGIILHTEDGGTHWDSHLLKGTFSGMFFADDTTGWVVGNTFEDREGGTIVHTEDGGKSWHQEEVADSSWFQSVVFTTPQIGWVVGTSGIILHTEDGGKKWDIQPAGTAANFHSTAFLNRTNGWVVGDNGTLLHTSTSGKAWDDPRRYSRWPAPMFYIGVWASLGLMLLGTRLTNRNLDEATTERSIADMGVSDRPLTGKEFDALEFGPLAAGIAGFLRNKKTTGPLTLAVVGRWGSGKSSIMGLLKEKLADKGIRPVWFNAWHHQDEQQLLAAFLESIRVQAVPPWYSPLGLRFRLQLINRRMRREWVTAFMGMIFFSALVALLKLLSDNGLSGDALLAVLKKPDLFSAGKLAVFMTAFYTGYKFLQGFQAFGLDPAKLLASVTEKAKLSDLGEQTSFRHRFAQEFEDVTAALQPRTMTVFVDDLDRCEPMQMMQVMQTLNFLSSSGECFLIIGMAEDAVTNGVAFNLQEQFAARNGKKLTEAAAAKECWDYAQQWMEKLIQIRVPVPNADDDQFASLLTGHRKNSRPPEVTRWEQVRGWLRQAWKGCLLDVLTPWIVLVTLAISAFLCTGNRLEQWPWFSARVKLEVADSHQPPAVSAWSTNSFIQPSGLKRVLLDMPAGVSGAMLMTNANVQSWVSAQNWTVNLEFTPNLRTNAADTNSVAAEAGRTNENNVHVSPAVTNRPFANPVTLAVTKGQEVTGNGWLPLLILPVLLIYIFLKAMDVLERRYDDSDDFLAALRRWSEIIKNEAPTPRAAKRLVNKLRFYAMMVRALKQAGNANVPENAIVAFGVNERRIEHGQVPHQGDVGKWLRIEKGLDPEKVLPSMANDLAAMEKAWQEHPEIFRYLSLTAQHSVRAE